MKLSYSTNSITTNSILESCIKVTETGYEGVELSFNKKQFNPFVLTDQQLKQLREQFNDHGINPVAISTATTFFLSEIPHEPSVISIVPQERQKRIDVIKQGLRVAKILGVPCVSFQSGYLRDYHDKYTDEEIKILLIASIREVLESEYMDDSITLVIEPEPGMYIESVAEALDLINSVANDKFKLHLDLCHTYCTEENYLDTIDKVASEVAYLHLADIKSGYNLKFRVVDNLDEVTGNNEINIDGYLFYIRATDTFRLSAQGRITEITSDLSEEEIDQSIKRENKAYIDSVEAVSLDILNKALPVLNYLRHSKIITKPICNTIQGKVHYHEFPGAGEIDFHKVMGILTKKYNGFVTVELYNHADEWNVVLPESLKYLTNLCNNHFLKNNNYIGEVDHRVVKAPYVRLASANMGINGDYTCMYDLRFRKPNSDSYIDPITMHSMEHALLYFFRTKYKSQFSCLAPMGCQTGFYLVLINVLNKDNVIKSLEEILINIMSLTAVPYQSSKDCGQANYHNLKNIQQLAKEILNSKNELCEVM